MNHLFCFSFYLVFILSIVWSVYFLVKFQFFIPELWERKFLQILYECWRRVYHALLAQLFISILILKKVLLVKYFQFSTKILKCYFLVHLDQRSRWTIAITWRPSSVVCRLASLVCLLSSVVWRLSSVVCKLFTFQASSPPPLGQLEPILVGMFLGWSSTKSLFFVPVGYSTWLLGPILCSDWLTFQRSSSLKLMNWLNPNCKWMIIGMSFTKFLFAMPTGNPRWPPSLDID
jgi:hypothetical protein